MTTMNLTEYAKYQGMSERTARRRFHDGTLPHPAEKFGRSIRVTVPDAPDNPDAKQPPTQGCYPRRTAAYVGATSRAESWTRISAVTSWAQEHGIVVDTQITDDDGSHQRLTQLLSDPTITRIITDQPEFDYDLISAALTAQGRELITTRPQSKRSAATTSFKPRVAAGAGA